MPAQKIIGSKTHLFLRKIIAFVTFVSVQSSSVGSVRGFPLVLPLAFIFPQFID
jgi:hypothetical protein